MKPNIKDISETNFLGIRTIFHPVMLCRKTPAVYKSYFDEGGDCFRDVLVEFLSRHSTRYCNGVRSFINFQFGHTSTQNKAQPMAGKIP